MKTNLAVFWTAERIMLLRSEGNTPRGYETLGVNDPGLSQKVKEFIAAEKFLSTLLIVPRAEILQKKMFFMNKAGQTRSMEENFENIFPYPAKEMAYSVVLDAQADAAEPKSPGLLYAIPNHKIRAIMTELQKMGIFADEVICEDQAIFWAVDDKVLPGVSLVLDTSSSAILALAVKKNAILQSNTYPMSHDLRNTIQEVSYWLMESSLTIDRVIISSALDKNLIQETLGVPVIPADTEKVGNVFLGLAISGALRRSGRPAISLLPTDQKLKNILNENSLRLKKIIASLSIFMFSLVFFHACHWVFLAHKKNLLRDESAKLKPMAAQVKKMMEAIGALEDGVQSKLRILQLIKKMAETVPAAVRIREMEVSAKGVVIQGESPSHSVLTQMTQEMEKMSEVSDVKLESARLRKRLNQDMVEFEVSSKWRN